MQTKRPNEVNGHLQQVPVAQAVLLVMALAAGTAHAQDDATKSEPAPSTPLSPVVVAANSEAERAGGPVKGVVAKRSATATKTDTPINEVPRSISVITREQIEMQAPNSMQEVLGYTPGIYAPPTGGGTVSSTSGLAIRGLPVFVGDAYFQDGMRSVFRSNFAYAGYEPYAFERVEVLRGPASIMYGQGIPNGTINMVTKQPTVAPIREMGVEIGSFNRKQVSGDFSGAIDDQGEWSYRLTGLARNGETQTDFSEDNRYFLAGALAWQPSARTRLVLRASAMRNEGEPNNGLPGSGTILPNPNGTIPRNRAVGSNNHGQYDEEGLGWQFEHQADDVWTYRSNMRVTHSSGVRQLARNAGFQAGSDRVINRNVFHYRSMSGNYALTLDNHAQARFKLADMEHTVLVGVDFAKQRDGWLDFGGTANPIDIFDPVYTPATYNTEAESEDTVTSRQVGLYLNDQIKFGKHWVVTVGGRKDRARSSEAFGPPGNAPEGPTQKDSKFTWQGGVAYLLDGGLTPYASYATSFLPAFGSNYLQEPFKPETGRQYEVGVKFQPPGSNTMVSAALFDLRRRNVTTDDLDHPGSSIQTGEVASSGLELEAKTELVKRLTLLGSYAYTKARVTQSNVAGEVGSQLSQSPRHTAAGWVDYAASELVQGLTVGAGLRYIGATWGDSPNTLRVPGYTLVDVALRYDFGMLHPSLKDTQAYLNVKNLTDKTTTFCNGCGYGVERNITAGVRVKW